MSFTSSTSGTIFHAAHFLVDDEACLRQTATIAANHAQAVTRGHRTIVPAGAVIPANDETAIGILYEDIDVTDGDAAGSIVVEGTIYGDRLPEALSEDTTEDGVTTTGAATALNRITVKTSPTITRPDFGSGV